LIFAGIVSYFIALSGFKNMPVQYISQFMFEKIKIYSAFFRLFVALILEGKN